MRVTRIIQASCAAAVAAVLATACSSGSGSGSGGGGTASGVTTNMPIVATFLNSIPAMASLEVAKSRGYFKDAGLNLTFASAAGGGSTLRPITEGDADVAIGSPAASVLAVQQNPNLKIAAIWLPYNPFYFISTKPLSQPNGATVGASVGASTVNLLLKGLSQKMHVTFNVQKAGTGSMADEWDAVKSGHVQASWAMEPFLTQEQEQSGAQVVIPAVQYLPDYPADFVVVNETFAKAHLAAMKAFFRAVSQIFGQFSDKSAQPALAKDLAKYMVFPEQVIAKSFANDGTQRLAATYSLKMSSGVLQNVSSIMQADKLVTAPVDWSKLIDQSYLPAADQISLP
jgi:NitT/TauT family transport system substrate-binding protein